MHKNIFWQAFLIVIFLIVLWYTGVALYRYYTYSRLTSFTQAIQIEWTVRERASDEYVLEASYLFEANGTSQKGKMDLKHEIYRNRWAAEQMIPQYTKRNWTVWYDPSQPNHSSLQKSFPLKESISAGFLWILFFYFLWLGFYVAKYKT
jgi:hypothetical protein